MGAGGDGASAPPGKGGKGASGPVGKSSKAAGGGGDKARRKNSGGTGGKEGVGGGSSSLFSGLGRLGDSGKGTSAAGQKAKGASKNAKGKPPVRNTKAEDKVQGDGGGPMQTLAAVGESFSAGAAAFQDRFSEISSQNVSFLLPMGKVAELTVPWKGVGIYAGGLLSGLALAVGLLTVPYTELGSPGLRKSLTLFENVLVDIDQVRICLCVKGGVLFRRWGEQMDEQA